MSFEELTNEAALKALSIVAKQWITHRALDAFIIFDGTRTKAARSYEATPPWASKRPTATDDSGNFARKMLLALKEGNDEEVSSWTDHALKEVSKTEAHVLDPISLAIGGIILIGAILAARVKRIGAVEFNEGIPKELADVLNVASKIIVP